MLLVHCDGWHMYSSCSIGHCCLVRQALHMGGCLGSCENCYCYFVVQPPSCPWWGDDVKTGRALYISHGQLLTASVPGNSLKCERSVSTNKVALKHRKLLQSLFSKWSHATLVLLSWTYVHIRMGVMLPTKFQIRQDESIRLWCVVADR